MMGHEHYEGTKLLDVVVPLIGRCRSRQQRADERVLRRVDEEKSMMTAEVL
jgi:hypothetical protein